MFIEVNKDSLNILDNSFIDKNTVSNDLDSNPFGHYLLLVEDNEVIGYIYYSDIYDRAEINQIEVNFIHRNCGKGSILLEKMILVVDKNITLEVKIDNIPAIKLYKKYGFEQVAIRKGYYNGVDGILMERKKTL
ncbi:MAG: GNAT family N-acetyltransferase [Bacilli bacterium]|nr:GNAT family N-acetyltransferase [Bacilli bacterium]